MQKKVNQEIINKVSNGIKILENVIIKKIEIIDKDSIKTINSITKAVNTLIFELESEILRWKLGE